MSGEQGTALIAAGKAAFSATHVALLSLAAAVIAALAVAVYVLLARYRPIGGSSH
nr:hypothetical protein [Marinicella sp. W31]MDC2880067.1 hypothetical protein [Marinicella sp. W31]